MHQRKAISLGMKIAILYHLVKGKGSTMTGKHFNLGKYTERVIKKNEGVIRKYAISGTKISANYHCTLKRCFIRKIWNKRL